jgi:hypothetical protein
MPAIDSHSKVSPLSRLSVSTSATMLPSQAHVGSLTHGATREPLKFRDLVSAQLEQNPLKSEHILQP